MFSAWWYVVQKSIRYMTTSLSEIHSRHVLALPSTMASQKSHGMGSRDEFGVWIKTSLNQPSSDITIIRISYLYYINSRYPNILPLYVPTYAPKLRSGHGGVFRTIRSSGGKWSVDSITACDVHQYIPSAPRVQYHITQSRIALLWMFWIPLRLKLVCDCLQQVLILTIQSNEFIDLLFPLTTKLKILPIATEFSINNDYNQR